jgi:lipoprotein-releasing system permease protein
MIRPLSLYIGLRYTRAKRRSQFISFISLASMLGIALGVMVLITVLSVMNGFDDQIRQRFFAIAPEVTAMTSQDILANWQKKSHMIADLPQVAGVAPYVSGKGMLMNRGQIEGVQAVGVMPSVEPRVSKIASKMVRGKLTSLRSGTYNMIIGLSLAQRLGLRLGDRVNLLTPQVSVTLAGAFPRYRRFTISGIFHTGSAFGFENGVAYIHMDDAARLFSNGQATSGYHVKLNNLYDAPAFTRSLRTLLGRDYSVTNWTMQFGAFFQALAMEKTMLFVILFLIVAVAVFNLVSTLVMVVNDKQADIAILRTLGASPGMIMRTIMIQGAVIGMIGTLLGLGLGVLLASHVTAITNAVQDYFGVQLLDSSVFFLDYLPSKIEILDVVRVCGIAFGLSVIATLYPAWIAFRTQPAEALRYE